MNSGRTIGASRTAAAEWRSYWYLPIAAAFGYSASVLHVYSMGPFFGPLQLEFGWSRAQISSGITIAALLSGMLCIPMGMLVDRLGPRRIALVGVLAMCTGVALLSTATGQMTNWFMLWAIVAIGTLGVQTTIWTSAVASRFETSRGLAFAITLSGASISAAVFPVMATWLIGAYGWRTAFVGMAGIWAALVFPIILFCFRGVQDQRREQRTAVSAAASALPGLTLSEGLRTPALYKLLTASALFAFSVLGVVVHFVPILKDSGATAGAAAGIVSLVGIFSIVGRLGTGYLLDRLPAHKVGAAAFLLPIIGSVALLATGSNPISQSIAAVAFGLTLGSEVDVVGYLAAKHFGLKNFGSLYGAIVMALTVGTAFGPLAAGSVFDHYSSYAPFLMLTVVLAAVSAITLVSLRPPRPH